MTHNEVQRNFMSIVGVSQIEKKTHLNMHVYEDTLSRTWILNREPRQLALMYPDNAIICQMQINFSQILFSDSKDV